MGAHVLEHDVPTGDAVHEVDHGPRPDGVGPVLDGTPGVGDDLAEELAARHHFQENILPLIFLGIGALLLMVNAFVLVPQLGSLYYDMPFNKSAATRRKAIARDTALARRIRGQ